jgi:hypothetical protein
MSRENDYNFPIMDDNDGIIADPDTREMEYFAPGCSPAFKCPRCPEVKDFEDCLVRYRDANSALERSKVKTPSTFCHKCKEGAKNREDYAMGLVFKKHEMKRKKTHG